MNADCFELGSLLLSTQSAIIITKRSVAIKNGSITFREGYKFIHF